MKKVLDSRTAEIIMVLKGQHNLEDGIPEDIEKPGVYLYQVALYMSDRCWCPFIDYVKDKSILLRVIQEAVLDYLACCDNPRAFMWTYFDTKRLFGSDDIRPAIYNDLQCWCAALQSVQVRENGTTYVNGFTAENTAKVLRKDNFLYKWE